MKTNKQAKDDARREYRRQWSKKKNKGSSTPGSTKNENTCQATGLDKFFAKYSRAHKHKGYQAWREKKRG